MWTATDETGRITCTTPHEEFADETMQDLDIFSEDFNFSTQYEYRIVDGALVHDPLPDPPEKTLAELRYKLHSTDSVVMEMYAAMLMSAELDDETASYYAEVLANRVDWQQQIKELEAQIGSTTEEEVLNA